MPETGAEHHASQDRRQLLWFQAVQTTERSSNKC